MALVGPRQSGKTTLARSLGGAYYDLEQEPERLRLDLDWPELVAGEALVILDEAQSWPSVFPRVRAAVDADRGRSGRFLLLGSVSPALMTQVSESLAGRLAVVELTPFLVNELSHVPLRTLWCRGGYPDGGVLDHGQFPQWQRDYLALLSQRDLPAWGLAARPQTTERLLKMLAAVHGQVWNASQLGESLGVSHHTADSYLDYLIGAFLLRRLPAYARNLGKRLAKRPKVYWRDSGLLHALHNVADERDLLSRPWVGASFEGFVIEQVLGRLAQLDRHADAFFLRTRDRHEIDLVLELGRTSWAVEVKLTTSPSPSDLERLNEVADLIGAERRILVTQTPEAYARGKHISCNLPWLLQHLDDLA